MPLPLGRELHSLSYAISVPPLLRTVPNREGGWKEGRETKLDIDLDPKLRDLGISIRCGHNLSCVVSIKLFDTLDFILLNSKING